MPTQKTGMQPPAPQPPATQPPTPSNPSAENLYGRDVLPVKPGDLLQSHIDSGGDPHSIHNKSAPTGLDQEQLNRMMPSYLKQEPGQPPQKIQAPAPDGLQQVTDGVAEEADEAERDAPSANDVHTINLLQEQLLQARSRGDDELSGNLATVLDRVVGNTATKRRRMARKDHPVFQRLKRAMGIGEKIQPANVEWGGFRWRVAAVPPPIDQWVGKLYDEELGNYSALKVSASVVGIDDVPIYDVLGIALEAEYEPTVGDTTPITVPLFRKTCAACDNTDLDVRATACDCGAKQDPFDIPLVLRATCAERLHEWFQSEFGPYESLGDLLIEMRKVIKDRRLDQEELYPFLKPSPEPGTPTSTSQSGEV